MTYNGSFSPLTLSYCCAFFFFFQAEDGIRDWSVTGVQTCALPILEASYFVLGSRSIGRAAVSSGDVGSPVLARPFFDVLAGRERSEERRVGEEGRGGGWRDH